MQTRQYTLTDKALGTLDNALRTLFASAIPSERPSPADGIEDTPLTRDQKSHIAGLMRINHAGEVSAQGLYQGQALTARLPDIREAMAQAALEEVDHLAWCEQRLNELGSHRSYLNPIWYIGSFAIGATAGLIGDQWSLGFVSETERQVIEHLETHLQDLPIRDRKTQAILEQMTIDEAHHQDMAKTAGGADLSKFVQWGMQQMSKVMTRTASHI